MKNNYISTNVFCKGERIDEINVKNNRKAICVYIIIIIIIGVLSMLIAILITSIKGIFESNKIPMVSK